MNITEVLTAARIGAIEGCSHGFLRDTCSVLPFAFGVVVAAYVEPTELTTRFITVIAGGIAGVGARQGGFIEQAALGAVYRVAEKMLGVQTLDDPLTQNILGVVFQVTGAVGAFCGFQRARAAMNEAFGFRF
jgi:hypothetical protein